MAMVVANFSRAETQELRRAVGMRRYWERMTNLERSTGIILAEALRVERPKA